MWRSGTIHDVLELIHDGRYKNSAWFGLGGRVIQELIQNSPEGLVWGNGNFLHPDQGITYMVYVLAKFVKSHWNIHLKCISPM